MSGRCKACDKKFSESECTARNPTTQEPEDLCSKCKRIAGIYLDDQVESKVTVEVLGSETYELLLERLENLSEGASDTFYLHSKQIH